LSIFIFLFALVYYFFNKGAMLIVLGILLIIFLLFDLINYFSDGKSKIARIFFKLYPKKKREGRTILTDATIFFISTILLVLIFQKEIVVFSLIILVFCDIAEQVFGIKIKSRKLFWNKGKNWAGLIGGFVISVIVGYLAVELLGLLSLGVILPISIVAAVAGTSPRYDNILIPWSVVLILLLIL